MYSVSESVSCATPQPFTCDTVYAPDVGRLSRRRPTNPGFRLNYAATRFHRCSWPLVEPPVTRSRRGTGFRDVLSLTRRSSSPLHNFHAGVIVKPTIIGSLLRGIHLIHSPLYSCMTCFAALITSAPSSVTRSSVMRDTGPEMEMAANAS